MNCYLSPDSTNDATSVSILSPVKFPLKSTDLLAILPLLLPAALPIKAEKRFEGKKKLLKSILLKKCRKIIESVKLISDL